MTEFDFSNERAWEGGGILSAGDYNVEVDDIDLGRSSGGHPQVVLNLRDLDNAGTIMDWIVLVPTNLGKWLQVTEAFGIENPGKVKIETEDGKPTAEWAAHVAKLGGKTCWIRVAPEQNANTGEFRDRVQFYTKSALRSDVPADTSGLAEAREAAQQDKSGVPF